MTGDEWLGLVRIARDLGNASLLIPDGISDLNDLPHPIFSAISDGLAYLSWRENLDKKEMPPRDIWRHGEKLAEWFEDLERRRAHPASADWDREIDDPVQNELALELRKAAG